MKNTKSADAPIHHNISMAPEIFDSIEKSAIEVERSKVALVIPVRLF